ncbi:regulator of sigma D [Vibrio xiamenensis]|uniref:Regulator of sigma D n=2 Tax=Vibrio xiamenensis TaxID=861298 RepID=A0A1G8GN25_9VIBR|nr:regulator of sigma D [Vibrio xiamenensis]
MLNKFKRTQEQWGGSSEVIDHWLDKRQALLVEYCKLASCKPCASKGALSKLPKVSEISVFCEHLVDYISEGHFKIYNMVMDKWRATGFEATDDINQSYGKIVLTTDPLLNFTDKYDNVPKDDDLEEFNSDLSLIGEILEVRFEEEDELIQQIADSLAIPPGA